MRYRTRGNRQGRLPHLALLAAGLAAVAAVIVACGSPATGDPETTPADTIAALPVSDAPPDVDNDVPAGECEDTVNILSRVDRDREALFRALAIDNRVGTNDGDGIRRVSFAVVGDGVAFAKDEINAPYCIFGSIGSNCATWPRDEAGHYTWGAGGPRVQPGDYRIFVQVQAGQPDSATGRASCEWDFRMRVLEP